MLPTSTTNVTGILPSYLYFQYQNDPDLPALIDAYNTLAQEYLDWFNNINLPIYTGLSGALLDWVGRGVYGIQRPTFATESIDGVIGQIAGVKHHGPAPLPTPNIALAISSTQVFKTTTSYDTPDDIYKRVLTWWFYKGDGYDFSIQWLKRRIYRFLFGVEGTDASAPFTPDISVTFTHATSIPVCEIVINNAVNPIATYFELAVEQGVLCLPFRFTYSVTINV
jgi:hypothetical protein